MLHGLKLHHYFKIIKMKDLIDSDLINNKISVFHLEDNFIFNDSKCQKNFKVFVHNNIFCCLYLCRIQKIQVVQPVL